MVPFSDATCSSAFMRCREMLSSVEMHTQTARVVSHCVSTGQNSTIDKRIQTEIFHVAEKEGGSTSSLNFAAVLISLTSVMCEELKCSQNIFSGYSPLTVVGQHGILHKCTLESKIVVTGRLQCVAVSWNATGAMVCAAFGLPNSCGWCDQGGIVCCWYLFRGDFSPQGIPSHTLEHSSCFTSLACHPSNPSLLAAGTFNGEVLIYDLALSPDYLKAISDTSEYFHREPISALSWTTCGATMGNSTGSQLVTVSGDCKALWWSLSTIQTAGSETSGRLSYPVRGMHITRQGAETSVHSPLVGGNAVALNHSSICIGSEGGLVLRYPTHSKAQFNQGTISALEHTPLFWEQSATELIRHLPLHAQKEVCRHVEIWAGNSRKKYINAKDILASKPMPHSIYPARTGEVTEFEPHAPGSQSPPRIEMPTAPHPQVGPATAITCSPFHRHLFMTVGVDGTFRLRSILQKPALLSTTSTIDGGGCNCSPVALYSADWSKARPMVFAIAGDAGVVRIYDLANAHFLNPAAELHVPRRSGPKIGYRVLSLQFNPKIRDFLACGDSDGRIHIWQLSWELSNAVPFEQDLLNVYFDGAHQQ